MKFRELEILRHAALPELAETAIDSAAEITARLAAFEAVAARVSEAAELWNGYSESERVTLRAAFAIDADAMARNGYGSKRIINGRNLNHG